MPRAVIETERLVLRPVAVEDEAAVLAALDDIQVVRWLAVVPYPYRPEHFRAWQPTALPGATWAVETPGGLIGVIGLTEVDVEDEVPSAEGGDSATPPGQAAANGGAGADQINAAPSEAIAGPLGDLTLPLSADAGDVQGAEVHLDSPPFAVSNSDDPADAATSEPVEGHSADIAPPSLQDPPEDGSTAQASTDAPLTAAAGDSAAGDCLSPDTVLAPRTAPATRLELGYWFARATWGRGYATEAVGAVVAVHFADPEAPPLTAHVHDGNIRSESVLRRIGFQTLGPRRYYAEALKREVGAITLRITRPDWLVANPIQIGTERLLMDPMAETDAAAFRRLVTYPAVGRNLFLFPPDWTDAAARRFIEDWRWQGQPPYRLAIRLRDAQGGSSLIGMIGIGAGEAPEIFYAIDPVHGRQGLMAEALAAFLAEVQRRHAPRALTARVFTDNTASARLLEQAGFIRQPGETMATSAARPDPAPVWSYRRTL